MGYRPAGTTFDGRICMPDTASTQVPGVYVSPDGARIAYDFTEGRDDAPVLVLLHGNHENRGVFDGRWEPYAARGWRVLRVDTRWHGASTNGTLPLTYGLFAEDLAGILAQEQVEKASLMGFSDGAITSMLFALEHPEQVERMVLIGGNLWPEALAPEDMADMKKSCRKASFLAHFSKKQQREKELLALMIEQPFVDPEALAALQMPALVVTGEGDCILPEHTELIARSLPHSTLCVVPAGKHNVMKHNAPFFDEALRAFLV